ncbi:MAG: aminoacetone oxidase family FAD-binding enzyme, partial [Verrucomicrobiota bacterium]
VIPAAPSLFTFKIRDARIADLAGLSVAQAQCHIPELKASQTGPVLITHWGLSGPAILKLSAYAARELHDRQYRFETMVNWLPAINLTETFSQAREQNPKKKVISTCPIEPSPIPNRLWKRFVEAAGISDQTTWSHLSKNESRALVNQLSDCRFQVDGKSMNKDEFVTCGGIPLKEVNLKTMESKFQPNLHFAGEVLDIDGITGGFNFQAAWTGGRLVGVALSSPAV